MLHFVTVSVDVEDSPENEFIQVKEFLTGLGADLVLMDSQLAQRDTWNLVRSFPRAKLGLNAVGGIACTNVVRAVG